MLFDDVQQINTIYENINKRNEEEYQNRIEKIYTEHKDLADIRKQLIQTKIELTKNKLSNDNSLIKKTEQELNDLLIKYDKALKDSGLTESDLERHYDCNDCKDTGFVDGKKCHCYIQKEIDIFRKISNFDNYKDILDKFSLNVYKQDIKSVEAIPYFEYMVNNFSTINEKILENAKNNKPLNIFFTGNTGTGKTFLSRYIEKNLIANNKTVIYITVNDLINAVFKDFNVDIKNSNPLFDYINVCDMLILDDLGNENVSDFSIKYIYNLIDNRINHNKSTIVCSQHNFTEIKQKYEAGYEGLSTRLFNYFQTIRLEGKDLRSLV